MSRINSPKRKKSFIRDSSAFLTQEQNPKMQLSEIKKEGLETKLNNPMERRKSMLQQSESFRLPVPRSSKIISSMRFNHLNFENHNIGD